MTMKKIITVLTIMISIPAFSQNHFIGLKGGVNMTNVNTNDFINDARIGFNAGLTYEYVVNNLFNVGVDFLYFQKGFTNEIGKNDVAEFNYDYLSIPIKVGATTSGKFSGFVNLGVMPSFLVNAKEKIPSVADPALTTYDVTDKVTKFDIGGMVEIGANYKIRPDFILSASLGYQHSVTSFANDSYFSGSEARHYGMVLSIGVKYALIKE
ncbi:MAG: hypothetical protein ACJAUV_000237 [Flavobacteriales bacterium]|jgi:hypothetical protein